MHTMGIDPEYPNPKARRNYLNSQNLYHCANCCLQMFLYF